MSTSSNDEKKTVVILPNEEHVQAKPIKEVTTNGHKYLKCIVNGKEVYVGTYYFEEKE